MSAVSPVPIESEAQWHEMRRTRLGASDQGALFGCGFKHYFQLWMEKAGRLAVEDLQGERIVIGRCVEAGIARAASELFGIELVKADAYYPDPMFPRLLGATPDYFEIKDGRRIVTEIKNASWGSWRDHWHTNDDGSYEAPERYSLQLQTQIAALDADEGQIIALIAGERLVRVHQLRHEDAIREIRRRTVAFWESIANNDEPSPDFHTDLPIAKRVWQIGGGTAADLSGDPAVEHWLAQLAELRDARKRIELDEKEINGEILRFCTEHQFSSVYAHGGRISAKQYHDEAACMVERAARKARIDLRVFPRRVTASEQSS